MADNLDTALAEGNGEKAVRLYWELVDQAYGKTAQQVEGEGGPSSAKRGGGIDVASASAASGVGVYRGEGRADRVARFERWLGADVTYAVDFL